MPPSSPPPRLHLTLTPRALAKPILHSLKYPHAPVCGVFLSSSIPSPSPSESKAGDREVVTVDDAWALCHSPPSLAPVLELFLMQVEEACRQKGMRVVGLYAATDLPWLDDPSQQQLEETEAGKDRQAGDQKATSADAHFLTRAGAVLRRLGDALATATGGSSSSSDSANSSSSEIVDASDRGNSSAVLLLLDPLELKGFLRGPGDSAADNEEGHKDKDKEDGMNSGAVMDSGGSNSAAHLFKVFAAAGASSATVRGWQLAGSGSGSSTISLSVAAASAAVLKGTVERGVHVEMADFEEHLDDVRRDWMNGAFSE